MTVDDCNSKSIGCEFNECKFETGVSCFSNADCESYLYGDSGDGGKDDSSSQVTCESDPDGSICSNLPIGCSNDADCLAVTNIDTVSYSKNENSACTNMLHMIPSGDDILNQYSCDDLMAVIVWAGGYCTHQGSGFFATTTLDMLSGVTEAECGTSSWVSIDTSSEQI